MGTLLCQALLKLGERNVGGVGIRDPYLDGSIGVGGANVFMGEEIIRPEDIGRWLTVLLRGSAGIGFSFLSIFTEFSIGGVPGRAFFLLLFEPGVVDRLSFDPLDLESELPETAELFDGSRAALPMVLRALLTGVVMVQPPGQ